MARPKIDEKDKKQPLHITMSKEHIELLRKLGSGNASEGIRYLINKSEEQ